MKKMEDKVNLTWWDFIIHQKEIRKEMESDSMLLDENQLYLGKLETTLQEKNYEIKQLTNDYDEISKLYALKERDLNKVSKQVIKLTKQLEKAQKMSNKQQLIINKLRITLGNKDDEIKILENRLDYSLSHRRAPDIEEIKAYECNKKEVLKKIRGNKNVSK